MSHPLRVLILCPDADRGAVLSASDPRFRCTTVRGAEASGSWPTGPAPDAVVLVGGAETLAYLEPLRLQYPGVSIFVLGARGGEEERNFPPEVAAIAAPIAPEALAQRILQATQQSRIVFGAAGIDESGLLGHSPGMEAVRRAVAQAADTDVTVLLRGESGTGKEVAARCLWHRSHRAQFSFIKVNCAAIPCELLESELFGYEAGAFTGAIRQKAGKFELAHRGTILLDEIGEMHPLLQAKLLHVLQDGEFCRLGGRQGCRADVRVLAATNVDLEAAVAAGRFRRDLFYRLSVVNLTLPPLRRRSEDIPVLLDHYCRHYATRYHRPLRSFGAAALAVLQRYSWPGNVRELENLAKRLVVMGDEQQILLDLETLPARLGLEGEPAPLSAVTPSVASPASDGHGSPGYGSGGPAFVRSALESRRPEKPSLLEIGRQAAQQAESVAILQALQQTRWNRRQAAELLQVSYKALQNKMKYMDFGASPEVSGIVPASTRTQ